MFLIYLLILIIYYYPNYYLIKLLIYLTGPIAIKIAQNIFIPEYGFQLNQQYGSIYKTNLELEGSICQIKIKDNFVIKSLKPNIINNLKESLVTLKNIISFYQIPFIFDYQDFSNLMLKQTNLRNEFINNIQIYELFDDTEIIIPKIIKYQNNKLFMEYSKGESLLEYLKKSSNIQNERIINLIHLSFYYMVVNNKIHGDFHLSNFLVEQDKLVIIDYGLLISLNSDRHRKLLLLFKKNFFFPEPLKIAELLIDINLNKEANIYQLKLDFCNYLKSINWIGIKEYMKQNQIKYYQILYQLLSLSRENNLVLPIEITIFIQSFLFIDRLRSSFTSNNTWSNRLKFAKETGFYKKIIDVIKN